MTIWEGDFAADEAVCRRCHAQIYDRLLPSRPQRGGSVQDAALADWAAASRHNAGVLVAVLHTIQTGGMGDPAGELVRRPPNLPQTPKRERVGAGIRTLSIGKTGLSLAHAHTRIFSSGSGNTQQLYDVSSSGLGPSWEVAMGCGNAPVCQAAPKQHRTCCHHGGGV